MRCDKWLLFSWIPQMQKERPRAPDRAGSLPRCELSWSSSEGGVLHRMGSGNMSLRTNSKDSTGRRQAESPELSPEEEEERLLALAEDLASKELAQSLRLRRSPGLRPKGVEQKNADWRRRYNELVVLFFWQAAVVTDKVAVMCTAAVAGMVLAAVVVASTATESRSCEDSSLVQLRKSNLVTNGSIVGSLKHSEELAVQLRHMAMVKATNGSVQPNYTVFRLDENASETTLQIINDSMNTFLDQVNISFHNDLQEIHILIQNGKECNQELSDRQEELGLNVTSVNDNVVAAEAQHDECRTSENFSYHANVTAFDALKSKVDLQLQRVDLDEVQVPEVRCMRNYIRPINPPFSQDYAQPSEYADALACAEEIRDWSTSYSLEVGGRLTNYTSANQTHANKISECNTLQGKYEQSFCSYKSNLLQVCGELDRCFGHAQTLYTATRELILQSNETRFRSFLVAKKVVCYINVLLRNLTVAAIHECDQKQINTSELNFTVPSLPEKAACTVSLVSVSPCDNEWIQTKYTNKSWYVTGAVQNAECEVCGIATTTTTSVAVSTIVASRYALCATTLITPTVSNLKCVTSVTYQSGLRLVGGNSEYVLLGTDRRAVEVLGPTSYTMCAKLDNSSVKCWGKNDYGQLGLGDKTDRGQTAATMGDNLTVLNLGSNLTILKVVSGEHHACAVVSNGKMKCWGRNQYGQLGRPETGSIFGDDTNEIGDQMPFVNFRSDEEVVDAAAGYTTSCAIFKNTSVACWGNNRDGMLGRGSGIAWSAEPQLVDLGAGHHAIQVAVGAVHICALLNTSKVKCWGAGSFGRLGNGDTRAIGTTASDMGDSLPTLPLDNVKHIAVGTFGAHTCVILKNNGVTCWGYNTYGQVLPGGSFYIGDQEGEVNSTKLIQLNDGSGQNVNATELALSDVFSCARLSNESIFCWGRTNLIEDYKTLGPGGQGLCKVQVEILRLEKCSTAGHSLHGLHRKRRRSGAAHDLTLQEPRHRLQRAPRCLQPLSEKDLAARRIGNVVFWHSSAWPSFLRRVAKAKEVRRLEAAADAASVQPFVKLLT
eukprot:s864_g5.t5